MTENLKKSRARKILNLVQDMEDKENLNNNYTGNK